MKRLLPVVLVLLSGIAQGDDEFVPYKTLEGCTVYVYKPYAESGELVSISWNGKCKNGKIDGIGRMITKSTREPSFQDLEWSEYLSGSPKIPTWAVYPKPQGQILNLDKAPKSFTQVQCSKTSACKAVLKAAVDYGDLAADPGTGLTTSKKYKKGSNSLGTADGFDISLQNGYVVATGGPCTAPGLYKVSVGAGAFEAVKAGTFLDQYSLDGVMHSSRGFDIHITLSPDVNWNETVRQNRREADSLVDDENESEDAEKEADVAECLARSQTQYAIAFERWMQANMP